MRCSLCFASEDQKEEMERKSIISFLSLVLFLFSCTSLSYSTPLPINSLPGVTTPLNFQQYAGYITVDQEHNRNLFYWFVGSQRATAKTDPVIVWFQGGPGCSSLIGLFTENGPFRPNFNGGLDLSPLSWNTFANMLYVEAPAGVGYSYSMNESDYNTNDFKTAADNLVSHLFIHFEKPNKFLELFFSKEFPEYQNNDLWIAGESYAGDYIPQLVLNESTSLSAQLKGFMIGNPCFDCPAWKESGNTIQVNLFFWHGLIPYTMYQKWMGSECSQPNSNPSQDCVNFFNDINNVIGTYDPDNFCSGNATLDATAVETPNCYTIFDARDTYLNRADVQAAIHAKPNTNWTSCASNSSLNYTSDWANMIPVYNYIFSKAPGIRVLIYSGDVDIATVPHAFQKYTQICLADLQRTTVQPWRPWTVNGQVAGYVEVYDKYTFATVKGAGHEVPSYQPWPAYNMIQRFLSEQPL